MPSILDEIPYSEFVANGVSTVFGYTFTVLQATDLVVYDNGVVVPSSNYSVSGIGVEGGGSVTFLIAPLNGHLILLSRELALERDTDYQYNGPLREQVLDNDFNRLWQALQGQRAQIGGALRAPYPEQFNELPNAANRANKVLAFDAAGAPILSVPASGSAAALALLLADTTLAGNGPGMVGYNGALAYVAGTVGAELQNKIPTVTSIAALKARSKLLKGAFCMVTGYYASGDGGGGLYIYDSTDTTSADNLGTIIVAADGGRWKLSHTGAVSVRQFGAQGVPGSGTPDTAAFQAAATANVNGTILVPTGSFNLIATINCFYNTGTGKSSVNWVGEGQGSVINWNGGNNSAVFNYEGTSVNAGSFSKTLIRGIFFKNPVAATGVATLKFGNFSGGLGMGAGVGNVTIEENTFDGFDTCIYTEYESDGFDILRNTFREYNSKGVYNTGTACLRIEGNYFQFGHAGSLAVQSQYSTVKISHNLIQSSATGVLGAIRLLNSDGVEVHNNYIEFAQTGTTYGIQLANSKTVSIKRNVIQGLRGADPIYIDATSANVEIGANTYGTFGAAPNCLVRSIAGASDINITAHQQVAGSFPPGTNFIGTGYSFVNDVGTLMLGNSTYGASPNPGVSMNAAGIVAIGNNAQASGWGFLPFSRSGVQIGSIAQSGTTAVVYNTTSDADLKNDHGVCGQTDIISRIVIHDFEWKQDGAIDRGGFAQEMALVKPSAVTPGSDERNENGDKVRPWAVDYSKFVPDLIVDNQDLRRMIGQLRDEINELKSKGTP
jgi:hypothetical protein